MQDQTVLETTIEDTQILTCPICYCDSTTCDFISIPTCEHIFCLDCFDAYTETEVANFNVLKIKCPEQTCTHILDFGDLEETLDTPVFENFKLLLLKKLANHSKTVNICPRPGCSKIFTPVQGESHTICACGAVICNLCCTLEHQGKSCVEALDPEFEVYASQNEVKFCIMCKTVVARVEGCPHITCPVCDYEWCWLCGREHSETHGAACPRKWDPLPPASVMKETKVKSRVAKWQRFKIWMKAFLKVMFYTELFWPYLLLNVPEELRAPENSFGDKCLSFMMAFVMHAFYMTCHIFFVIRMFITPHLIPIIFSCSIGLGMMPWIIKCFLLLCKQLSLQNTSDPFRPRRWKSRNFKEFSFTSSKVTELRNTANNDMNSTQNTTAINIETDVELAENAYNILTSAAKTRETEQAQPDKDEEYIPDLSAFSLKGLMP
jgi:hypothetical protein